MKLIDNVEVLIIGAGPAGLTAGYQLSNKSNLKIVILEEDSKYVGGISRTEKYKGYHFDIGGHRFFSKSKQIVELWNEILPNDFLKRPRKSRIFYKGKFYSYPLKAVEALFNLGLFESFLCIFSYLKARLFQIKNPKNFHEWVSNKFGERLFSIFFKSYTEKVWGINCDQISANWAAQRIKDLNMLTVILTALKDLLMIKNKKTPTTLIKSFYYPSKGPGMLWEEAARKIKNKNTKIYMGSKVIALEFLENKKWLVTYSRDKEKFNIISDHVISSMPMRELISSIKPNMDTVKYANELKYRDYITVAVILKKNKLFDDNWIYIHDPNVFVGRIQNYNSWSPEMIPNKDTSCLGLEFFCNEDDKFWKMNDDDLKKLAAKELEYLNLALKEDILDYCVVRQRKAYPVYDNNYHEHINKIKHELSKKYQNIHLIGRNGMHKYNNQDHAMMTGILTVENILRKKQIYDIWNVNENAEYIEEGFSDSLEALKSVREVPEKIK